MALVNSRTLGLNITKKNIYVMILLLVAWIVVYTQLQRAC